MSLLWKMHDLAEKIKHSKTLTKCSRCNTRYKKHLDICPACSDISDSELDYLLKKKINERENMGKAMFSFIAIFFALMFVVYGAVYYYNT